MEWKIVCLFFSIVLLAGVASAAPGIPHQFYGNVYVDGNLVNYHDITAEINGKVYGTTTNEGVYGISPNIFYIPDPDGNFAGETIIFFVNGKDAGSFVFKNNGETNLDFNLDDGFCGDDFCLGSENCGSCPGDCSGDAASPVITVYSPESNGVYNYSEIILNVLANQPIDTWMYSLNGGKNTFFDPNETIDTESEMGNVTLNNITIRGINTCDKIGSQTLSFSVDLTGAYCGDLVCDVDESCSICPGDCGACPIVTPKGGGGGSSGGGGGGAVASSSEPQELVPVPTSSDDDGEVVVNVESSDGQNEEEMTGFFSAITGAATGVVGSTAGIIVIVFILLIVLGLIIVKVKKSKN